MNKSLLMNFEVDKVNNKVLVRREFAANRDLVWRAWTDPEILDQWWAPKPYQTITKSMDFTVGGKWMYAMRSPEGETHWCLCFYKEIVPKEQIKASDAFCNEAGELNADFPNAIWENQFEDHGNSTMLLCEIQYESLADLETILEMGFEEGFTMALGNLDELLPQL